MRCDNLTEITHKEDKQTEIIHQDVVVVGNGPSGIAVSYMLSGNLPFVVSADHPDEMLAARLKPLVGQCLLDQDLENLAAGLEGRSTNPVSLLLDALLHPCADSGVDMEPLVEFRKKGSEIDHIVLGKGPPGGSWHTMDPHILTLSLGNWMALPGSPFPSKDSGEKRAFAHNVAKYYEQYVRDMNLCNCFRSNVVVTGVKEGKKHQRSYEEQEEGEDVVPIERKTESWLVKIKDEATQKLEHCLVPSDEKEQNDRSCIFSNALNYIFSKSGRKSKLYRYCKRSREQRNGNYTDQSPTRKFMEITKNGLSPLLIPPKFRPPRGDRSISFCCDSKNLCDNLYSRSLSDDSNSFNNFTLRNSCSLNFKNSQVVPYLRRQDSISSDCDETSNQVNWIVETCDLSSGKATVYTCKYLVLANGASDSPNRLEILKQNHKDPNWLFHDLRTLETHLDKYLERYRKDNIDPVLIVGAGLSAADAIIATRGRNIPVVHVFRNRSADLNKKLPENMYPEYHKVHKMMQDGGSTYPLYTSFPEYNVTGTDESKKEVIITSKTGEQVKVKVSAAAILIGSRPNLSFLPPTTSHLGIRKDLPIDSKTNTIDIDKLTHLVNGYDDLFAVGPLAGDNFVRFIPGGALAVVTELYKRHKFEATH